MARIRTIKPSFFQSDDVSALPLRARLTWIGLWTHCDDQGRAKDHPKLIKAAVWPLDPVSISDIEEDLSTLAEAGRIVRYQAQGVAYLAVVNWDSHQSINRPSVSRIPPPPVDSMSAHGAVTDSSHREGKGREGKGRDARERLPEPTPPSRFCQKHPTGTTGNCGACGAARKAAEAWEADRRARVDAIPDCPLHSGSPATNCGPCRSERLAAEGAP